MIEILERDFAFFGARNTAEYAFELEIRFTLEIANTGIGAVVLYFMSARRAAATAAVVVVIAVTRMIRIRNAG
ncbi:hypothetical protein EBQ34_14225 [Vandammella animalimorsus]|uniref:Uncharacterized protein n=1 Tax=Vandammella animalimorsus TaxID=2029117 RepID=A0A3M6R2R7_9BURK|nr:hypothetical protein EBQ34_14165 [Vandammella animalimorsus]RMX09043.1 hypothetical protein EBQ34_14225 [Vandammella animalimorsus]